MDTNIYGILLTADKLQKEGKLKETDVHFPSIVAELARFARVFRPDISFAAFLLTRYTHNYTISHIRQAIRVVKYLYTTKEMVWQYDDQQLTSQKHVLSMTFDSDYAGDKQTRKSTTGCVFWMNGQCIAHISKQQIQVTTSVGNAETNACFVGVKTLVFMKNLLSQHFEVELPMIVRGDNNTALTYIENEECSERTKHWDIEMKWLNELYQEGIIKPERFNTDENEADMHTKPLGREVFERHRNAIGIK